MMKKEKISVVLFYIAYTLLGISYICSNISIIASIQSIIRYVVVFVLMCLLTLNSKEIIKEKQIKCVLIFSVVILLLAITYINCDNAELIMTFIFLISCKNINIKKIIKYDCYLRAIVLIFVILLNRLGLVENIILYRSDGNIRQSLGLKHPNLLGLNLLIICCDIFYLNYENKLNMKKELLKNGLAIIILLFIIYICDSRASEVCIVALVIGNLILHLIKDKKYINKIILLIPIIFLTMSIVFSLLYPSENRLILKLDKLTSTRIRCGYDFLEHYKINLFGHFFENYGKWDTMSYLTVLDNSYLFILLQFGVIPTIAILAGIYSLMKDAIKNKKEDTILYIIVILFLGLMEHSIYIIFYNPIILYLGKILCEEKVKKSSGKEHEKIIN